MSECSDISQLSDFEEQSKSLNFDLSNGSPIDRDNFTILHYNINSILAPGKLEQLEDNCRLLNIGVLIITESKLDSTIPTNLLTIPGYHEPIRHDRLINGRYGGGVLMYIGNNLVFQHRQNLQSDLFEHIWADITVNGIVFAINAFYRPPNETSADHDAFLEFAEDTLSRLNNYKSAQYKIIASDLNFGNCYSKSPILIPKSLDAVAPDVFSSYGFIQLIDIPTRITENSMSLIDLIFVNKPDDVICHGTVPKIADHDGVIVCFNTKNKKPKNQTKVVFDYTNADIEGLIKFIKECNFNELVFSNPVTDQADIFGDILKDAFHRFVPNKSVVIRPSDQSWCNTFTRLLLRKKNRNYLFFKKCEKDYLNCLKQQNPSPELVTRLLNKKNKASQKSREAANDSNKANRRAKAAYFNTINDTLKSPLLTPKKKFNILLKLMKSNKFSSIPPLVENNNTIHDPLEKSNIFNTHFASKSTVRNSNDPVPNLTKKEGITNLNVLNTSPIEVAKIIRNIKKSHFSQCGIPGKFIHLISTPISFPFSRLLNNIFEEGHFPTNWKIAHVTAVYKRSGPKTDKSSFRPISILPTLSKICESVIHDRLFRHCLENDIITEKQAAYIKGDSTVSQLLYIVHNIRKNWCDKNITHGLFLDVSSAFDKVWHQGLLAKLDQIGVEGTVYDTIKSYLTDRKQIVVVDGEKSDISDIKAGIPQGSRLGPLLFIIYMNDIIDDIESDILIFADDTSLFAHGPDPAVTAAQLNCDLVKIPEWATK